MSQRAARATLATALLAGLTAGCATGEPPVLTRDAGDRGDAGARAGRLGSPWTPAGGRPFAPGLHKLRSPGGRPALLLVSPAASAGTPLPLMVMLHGAGSRPASALRGVRQAVAGEPVNVLAPASRARTWDIVTGSFGPDVRALESLLRRVTRRLPVERSPFVIAGHSDGASYALSLGLTNGDRFTHVLAFSPGFAAPAARRGRPRLFVAHGVRDRVLPIDRTSRRLVPALRDARHRVRYEEFDGGHGVDRDLAREAVRWALDAGRRRP